MTKEYNKISIKPMLEIESVIYIVHNQKASEITHNPGRYSFWQLYYVADGEVSVMCDSKKVTLRKGEAYIFYPHRDLRYAVKAEENDGVFSVISFECNSNELSYLSDRIITLNETEAFPISDICSTGQKVLEPIKHNEEKQGLCEKSTAHPAVLQYIKVSLEQFLIKLYCREKEIKNMRISHEKANRYNYESNIVKKTKEYMRENVQRKLTIGEIAEAIGVNETTLRITYKKETGISIIKAFSKMKIAKAQMMISETDLNFTEISGKLGFLSLYHFSRFFKEHTGITLSEYSKTIAKKL